MNPANEPVVLFQVPPVWGLPSMSPFCVKLETYFKMTGVPYKNAGGNPMQAPKGKIPYVKIDGKTMGDSVMIIDYLKQSRGDTLDGKLSPEQKALAVAVRCLVEEHLYFAAAYLRWTEPESFPFVKTVFKNLLPPVIGGFIFKRIKKDMLQIMKGQGMGRHSKEEIVAFAREDLAALSTLLGDKPFFFGSVPTSIDATLFGFLIQLLWVPWESEVVRAARALPNLEAYCQRMKQKYWA